MTPDERKMLTELADKFRQTPAPPRDPEAEQFIRSNIGSRPDALYMMTQTVLIQNLALQHAQEQIRELQARTSQPAQAGSSFLGQPATPRGSGAGYQAGGQQYQAPPPPRYAQANPSGAPSFLRGAAQTAAGVAAGALAFAGIQSLFSHPGYGGVGGFGGAGFMGGGGVPGGETVVNNYYDGPQDSGDYQAGANDASDSGQYDDSGQLDDSGQFDDSGQIDDASDLDSGDGGGFDDGSGGSFA